VPDNYTPRDEQENTVNISELTKHVEAIEAGVGAVGAGHPSPSVAYTENPAEYRALTARLDAALARGRGLIDAVA
jgi:hypothetical protein